MSRIRTFFCYLLGGLLLTQAMSAMANEACFHNLVRDAVSEGKAMTNLGPLLDQSYDFSVQRQPATPLVRMSVNSVLQSSAAAWASNCRFDHSSLPGRGENLFVGTETYLNPADWETDRKWRYINAINDWAYEARLLTIGTGITSCVGGAAQCGHYTQMVWDDTTQVGCAAQFCSSVTQNGNTIFQGRQATLIVCHYSPQGNYVQYIGGPYLPPYDLGADKVSSEPPVSGCEPDSGGEPNAEQVIDITPVIELLLN